VSGSHVVLLGFSMDPRDCEGLAGFAIERTDLTAGETQWLIGNKAFQATASQGRVGGGFSSRQHPIQGFTWSDYNLDRAHRYQYRVVALKGPPEDLREFAEASIRIETETPESGDHDVYFNRGVAASQAYSRRFGTRSPDAVGEEAYSWLSRGLAEGIDQFIGRAADDGFGLRVAAYEFSDEKVLASLKAAIDRGADVKIVYDRRKAAPGDGNAKAVRSAGLEQVCTPRQQGRSHISHNKFIILLRDGAPQAVLTGGTNFSKGGIYGHSNVVHVVEEPSVAARYFDYWERLQKDPRVAQLARELSADLAIPAGEPPSGTTAIFSPRRETDALDYYVGLARGAKDALFVTFAFGMNRLFQDVFESAETPLRYATMERDARPQADRQAHEAERERIRQLRLLPENRFAIGSHLTRSAFDRWLGEHLSNLNRHVRYIHNKFMLIDPLGEDPIVVTGSANFSTASSTGNDENMLVIRGNRRVADIYLGEFMRIYAHHAFREFAQSRGRRLRLQDLRTDDWWRAYFGDTPQSRQRAYFSQTFQPDGRTQTRSIGAGTIGF
jgi:hypothetical protein